MPQIFRRHSEQAPRPPPPPAQARRRPSVAAQGPQLTDADDSIVLSDLVRTGEASRLRRRGALRLDHTAAGRSAANTPSVSMSVSLPAAAAPPAPRRPFALPAQ